MDKIDCNRDGSISVYEWIEQGKSIGLLDPLTHTKDGKDKGKKSKVQFLFFFIGSSNRYFFLGPFSIFFFLEKQNLVSSTHFHLYLQNG